MAEPSKKARLEILCRPNYSQFFLWGLHRLAIQPLRDAQLSSGAGSRRGTVPGFLSARAASLQRHPHPYSTSSSAPTARQMHPQQADRLGFAGSWRRSGGQQPPPGISDRHDFCRNHHPSKQTTLQTTEIATPSVRLVFHLQTIAIYADIHIKFYCFHLYNLPCSSTSPAIDASATPVSRFSSPPRYTIVPTTTRQITIISLQNGSSRRFIQQPLEEVQVCRFCWSTCCVVIDC